MALISRILAPGIFGAEMEDVGQPVLLAPEEEALLAKAAPKRRRDFALGRSCAHKALAALGHDIAVIGRCENGAPSWPHGTLGSITHTCGYAAALVGDANRFSGIGLDAERIGGVGRDIWPRLFGADERDYLEKLEEEDQGLAATLFFCAKEACYKAWKMETALRFHEIHVTRREGGFIATRSDKILEGRFAVQGDLLLAATWF
ncbi:MAG: 4'-phosphopantetheinyl transferase superfamily protein [Rhizomicrobium sp.]